MEKQLDFSRYYREIEIIDLEGRIEKLCNEALQESIKSYGREYGPMMACTKLSPMVHVYQSRITQLKRERLEDNYNSMNESYRDYMKKMYSQSQRGLV